MRSDSKLERIWLFGCLFFVLGVFIPFNIYAFGQSTRQFVAPILAPILGVSAAGRSATPTVPPNSAQMALRETPNPLLSVQLPTRIATIVPTALTAPAPPTAMATVLPIETSTSTLTPTPLPTGTPTAVRTFGGEPTDIPTPTETPVTTEPEQPLASDSGDGTLQPTPDPLSTALATEIAQNSGLLLGQLYYTGNSALQEADEFIQVLNIGSALNVAGWRLRNQTGAEFQFPDYEMAAAQSCRVYTNEIHDDSCGFSFNSSQPIWNNDGDVVLLLDPAGNVVGQRCWRAGCQFGD